jgi:hypothetical protein
VVPIKAIEATIMAHVTLIQSLDVSALDILDSHCTRLVMLILAVDYHQL